MAVHRLGSASWALLRTRAATLADLSSLTPGGFAQAVSELLRDLGYHYVYAQLRSANGDAPGDVLARDPNGRRVLVACRGYGAREKVSAAELRAFAERLAAHPSAEAGMVVTTASFAAGAWAHGLRRGIHLVDGSDLVRLLAATSRLAPAPRRRLEWTG